MTSPTPPEGASGDLADQARPLAAGTRHDLGRLADIRVPDSAAAAEAERLARAESSPMLYGHALRSYFYAALLAARDGMRYDEELLAGYLRAGFRYEFAQLLRREAARKPTGHAALLLQQGLQQPITHAPFAGER